MDGFVIVLTFGFFLAYFRGALRFFFGFRLPFAPSFRIVVFAEQSAFCFSLSAFPFFVRHVYSPLEILSAF
jgi:hypothetical protein